MLHSVVITLKCKTRQMLKIDAFLRVLKAGYLWGCNVKIKSPIEKCKI